MPPKRLDALIAIGTWIAPKAKLTNELVQAFEDPDDYAAGHAAELEARGVDAAAPHLAWLALILGLAEAGAVVELDEAIGAEAVRRAIEQLPGCPRGTFTWMKHDAELAERSTAELAELAGKALLARGVQLIRLHGHTHGVCVMVVPRARTTELTKLVRAAGHGEAEPLTGAGLSKATKDRVAAARRTARKSAAGARRTAAPELRYFARGKETWTLTASDAGFETCYEKPRVKFYVHHYFDDAAAARAGGKRLVAEWTAAGFREVDEAAWRKLPHADAPYINWTAPFPDDASYVVEGKEIVRCTELRDSSIVELAGTIGYNFGELQNVYHCKTAAAAAKRYAQHIAADAHFPAISRAEVIKRYR